MVDERQPILEGITRMIIRTVGADEKDASLYNGSDWYIRAGNLCFTVAYAWDVVGGIRVTGDITAAHNERKPFFTAKTVDEAYQKLTVKLLPALRALAATAVRRNPAWEEGGFGIQECVPYDVSVLLSQQQSKPASAERRKKQESEVSTMMAMLEAEHISAVVRENMIVIEFSVGTLVLDNSQGYWDVDFVIAGRMHNEAGILAVAKFLDGRKP